LKRHRCQYESIVLYGETIFCCGEKDVLYKNILNLKKYLFYETSNAQQRYVVTYKLMDMAKFELGMKKIAS
jgi:hypothetical protein